ncbi:hypothetical protein N8217_02750 [Glaciecola sp.]|nr:hypothetical protein [Glaciecola sp.]
MKFITSITAILLMFGCATTLEKDQSGNLILTDELKNDYYQQLGTHKKASFFKHIGKGAFITNAYRFYVSKDEFHNKSWNWYIPQSRLMTLFGSTIDNTKDNIAFYFTKKENGSYRPYLYAKYRDRDWLFFDSFAIKVKGKKALSIKLHRSFVQRDVESDGYVKEVYNSTHGALQVLEYLSDVADMEHIEIRLIASNRQQEHVSYSYYNNSNVIKEMLELVNRKIN